ncbi:g5298 [Coccomyxa elongata]
MSEAPQVQAILEDNAPDEQKGKPQLCAREQDDMQQQENLEMQQGPKHQQLQMERQPSSDSAEEGFQASMSALMYLLSNHEDKHAAVAAALNAVLDVPRRQASAAGPPEAIEGGADHYQEEVACRLLADIKQINANPAGHETDSAGTNTVGMQDSTEDAASKAAHALREELAQALNPYPRCKHLISLYRTALKVPNKTPLSILHEYATRLNLEMTFSEAAESNGGPFIVEAHVRSVDDEDVFVPGIGKGPSKKMARQLAAAAVLDRLVEQVGVHEIVGRQARPEPKDPQVHTHPRGPPPPNQGHSTLGYAGRPGAPHARRPPRNAADQYGLPGYGAQHPGYGHQGYARQPQQRGPVSNRPPHMRNSPASGWTRAPPPPPPPPPQRPAGAGALGQPLANRDARLPLQPFRAPYNPQGKEGAALGDPMAEPPLAPELACPRPLQIPRPSRDAMSVEMALPMTHPMPGSMGFGSALSYASSYLMDANLGLNNGPQTVLDTLQLGSLSTDLGMSFAREDLGGGPASENFMALANQRADVETFELAQLRAHIGRIAAKSGVPVNPKHAQALAAQNQLFTGAHGVHDASSAADAALDVDLIFAASAGSTAFPDWPPS